MPNDQDPPQIPEDARFDYQGACWWCGAVADSREHKYKKSDVIRQFGKGPWSGKAALLRVQEDNPIHQRIRGPDSNGLKFDKSLCQRCNNTRSQPFDYAYDKLSEYITTTARRIADGQRFKLSDVYGKNWRDDRDDAVRYFVKHISCRLADDRVQVPSALIRFLDGASAKPQGLSLDLSLRLDIFAMEHHLADVHNIPSGSLWMGGSQCRYSQSRHQITELWSHIGFGALRAGYHIDFQGTHYRSNLRRNKVRVDPEYNIDPHTVTEWCQECSPPKND
ncbi:hypothetical protein [Actinomadura napierensis]|uniref:HNH endonuclease n=1 Tax=Actinomadura napierensis TaxID=267854 RepID=A0ABN3AC59_9ACTN